MSNHDETIVSNVYVETLIRSQILRLNQSNISYFDSSSLSNFLLFVSDCEQYVEAVEPYRDEMIAYAKTENGKAFYQLIQQADSGTLQAILEQNAGTTQFVDSLISPVVDRTEAPESIQSRVRNSSVVKFCKEHLQNNVVTRKWKERKEERAATGKTSLVRKVVKFGAVPFRGIQRVLDYVPNPGTSLVKRG